MDGGRTRAIVRLTAAAMALGLIVSGCSKDDSSSSDESSSSASSSASSSVTSSASATSTTTSAAATPAAQPKYEALLMKPEDLPEVSTGPWTAGEPKVNMTPPPPDVNRTYTSGTNSIDASILVAEDAPAATKALAGAANTVPTQVTGNPAPAPAVTPDATLTIGTSPDGKSATAALLFTVENTAAVILFTSAPGDLNPVPQDFAEAVGQAQVAAIQAGLPGLK